MKKNKLKAGLPKLSAKNPSALLRWKAVKDLLDFEDEGKCIFSRAIPLVDASLARIYAGLCKVAHHRNRKLNK